MQGLKRAFIKCIWDRAATTRSEDVPVEYLSCLHLAPCDYDATDSAIAWNDAPVVSDEDIGEWGDGDFPFVWGATTCTPPNWRVARFVKQVVAPRSMLAIVDSVAFAGAGLAAGGRPWCAQSRRTGASRRRVATTSRATARAMPPRPRAQPPAASGGSLV